MLSRYRLDRLAWLDRPTGRIIRRYDHPTPGDLVHVDVKKLGRIPPGGGWRRIHGRAAGPLQTRAGLRLPARRPGRPLPAAYTELLGDERQNPAAAFWTRAQAFFAGCGITVRRVLTDNGSCYRSRRYAAALSDSTHQRTRPYRPATNCEGRALPAHAG